MEHISSGERPGGGSLLGKKAKKEPDRVQREIAGHVGSIIRDGDCLQIGVGRSNEPLIQLGILDGKSDILLQNTSTGEITRTAIPVLQDASSDTLTEIASFINGASVANVSASVNSSNQLTITADTGYKFDFIPAVLPEPTNSDFTGATSPPTISVSSIYTGTANDTFRFTVSGAGSVGNGNLQLVVKDGGGTGSVIATLNIGKQESNCAGRS